MEFEHEVALDLIAEAYGWKNTRSLWMETRGFTMCLESSLKDYPIIDGTIDPDELKDAIYTLRDFDDPINQVLAAINVAIEEDGHERYYGDYMADLIEKYGETTVAEILKKHGQEQLLEDYKNAHENELLEAQREYNGTYISKFAVM
ncbi:hypothetical protein R80B4_01096 [Fibrobacteres bacterium R8-0-B4]